MTPTPSLIEKIKKIKCLVCDLDGVMTSGLLFYDDFGHELKAFHVHDGIGLKLLMAVDIHVAVITGAMNAGVDYRMQALGIKHYFTKQINKQAAFEKLQKDLNLEKQAFAYIGDDFPDIPLIQQVGFGIAVANATPYVKKSADFETILPGGRGAVREICDLILQTQGKMDLAIERYLT